MIIILSEMRQKFGILDYDSVVGLLKQHDIVS